ncbi:MAG: hypothetical protein GY929_04780 [Actinomycetia bacterium]|nr:hypothetical protein [Actinomycetes bacterium]
MPHLFYFVIPAPRGAESRRFPTGLFPDWDLHQGDAGWHINCVVPPRRYQHRGHRRVGPLGDADGVDHR